MESDFSRFSSLMDVCDIEISQKLYLDEKKSTPGRPEAAPPTIPREFKTTPRIQLLIN